MKVFKELRANPGKFKEVDDQNPAGYEAKLKAGQTKFKQKDCLFFPQFSDKVYSYQDRKMIKRDRAKSITIDSIERFQRGPGCEWQYQKFEQSDGTSRNDELHLY